MKYFPALIFVLISIGVYSQLPIKSGAEQPEKYVSLLADKNIALIANHTSQVGSKHLLDFLLENKIKVVRVFSPEHGFRGNEDAGERVSTTRDKKTGVSIISLYGRNNKPLPRDLKGIDMLLFDLQDVGVRFYTYLSTLHYVMEACAENGIPLILLDRPNPNGFYIDGPVMEKKYQSFVGLHPVPIVYGMTIGEYAGMINGEGWLAGGVHCDLHVVTCLNYSHSSFYRLPVKPSPNLPDMLSVYLYPSLALFEGTTVSVGRGTENPFHQYGSPLIEEGAYQFTPRSIPGMSTRPMYEGMTCNGWDLSALSEKEIVSTSQINLEYLEKAFKYSRNQASFFNNYFNLLAGNSQLQDQIRNQVPPEEIRESWEPGLAVFRSLRSKYLLYP